MVTVAVIGLGYVGLPLALLAAKKYNVFGIDKDKKKLNCIKNKINYLNEKIVDKLYKEVNLHVSDKLACADIYIIAVPTPIDKCFDPDLKYVRSASEDIKWVLKEGDLIILESTVNPGITENVVKKILDKTNKKYYLAHCPERIDPGNSKFNVKNINRVVGGIDKDSTKLAAKFYRNILNSEIVEVNSVREAELTKILENSFRNVNIAFINEMAMFCDKAGLDITQVIKGSSTKQFAFLPHFPSIGIGGHCIPVDPCYQTTAADALGFNHQLLKKAININRDMPSYCIGKLQRIIRERFNLSLSDMKIGILGIAYKADVKDDRESPSYAIIHLLNKLKANFKTFDPYFPEKSNVKQVYDLKDVEVLILATNHKEFKNIELKFFKSLKIILDGKNFLDKEKIEELGIIYVGVGR
ncbi:nucleotide sugar dehydrogenase [Candidatus Woesearchaeota archaeon]|nr:nucleotide sugar dehydrogenase [Candidatus Woesearchaeota archaeon]